MVEEQVSNALTLMLLLNVSLVATAFGAGVVYCLIEACRECWEAWKSRHRHW